VDHEKEWVIEEPESDSPSVPDGGKSPAESGEACPEGSQKKPCPAESDKMPAGPGGTAGETPGQADAGTPPSRVPDEGSQPESGERPGERKAEGERENHEAVQKRTKRAGRKELLELMRQKNDLLVTLDNGLKKANQDLRIKEDRLLRLAAEFENYKKRMRREWELLQKRANADLIKEIIGAIDNFDRAFANLEGTDGQLHDGIRLIQAGLLDVLKRAGLREIEALNQKFDPVYHEAVGELESEEVEEGHVAQVVQKGYFLNDNLLRPARVMVAKKKGGGAPENT
jgi:molecular chaperone GrpE